ncbi:AI-2E family transporter [Bacillus sp. AFS015896]|uniref:AI-2E family transporter n=2 Tax=Bacillus TaxID=1386 RepID=A0A2A8IVP8_BACCE|nr:AI-2E family transporter [Bacillus cereus]PFA65590.1 AI-2E family transporter [Bacillus sp. AFS015896]PGT96819.1 AI-2E family transporter [Bacillus cereus]PGX14826.1 AI-2E family transporter [Bacillus sp. AFS033286]PGZ74839.1 AI-2E family transporter [Bacillus sp. AFS029637]
MVSLDKENVRKRDKLKKFFREQNYLAVLLGFALLFINILLLTKISFVFTPFIVFLKTIFFPVLLAGVLFYILHPFVSLLEKKGVSRIVSIASIYIIVLGLFVFLVVTVIPIIKDQIDALIRNLPYFGHEIERAARRFGESNVLGKIQENLNIDVANMVKDYTVDFTKSLSSVTGNVTGFLSTVTEVVLTFVMVPFILFYLLKDGEQLPNHFLKFISEQRRPAAKNILDDMHYAISSYIRGQIIVSLFIGIMLLIGYLIIGIKYAVLLAILAMIVNIVPYVGPVIAITPALIIAFIDSPAMVLKVIIVMMVVQLAEGKFISPQVMGKKLDIHPITIIFIILTAGNLFGIMGVILAIPGYAILKVLVTHGYRFVKLNT